MIDPNDERALRLIGFIGGLFAIAIRTQVALTINRPNAEGKYERVSEPVSENVVAEARAIAASVVEEAKRLGEA